MKTIQLPIHKLFDTIMADISIAELTDKDAPVAITASRVGFFPITRGYGGFRKTEYRWFGEKLFLPVRLSNFVCLNGKRDRLAKMKDMYLPQFGFCLNTLENLKKYYYHLIDWAQKFILVDGVLHGVVGEPRYVVQTFGMGHNHGGTALMVEHSYNPNIPHTRYFPITQHAQAVQLALEIATKRGDTESVVSIKRKNYPQFKVLDKSVIRLRPGVDYKGEGDGFLNHLEAISETAPDVATAGLLAIASALKA